MIDWNNKRVLVTGGTGFIGSVLVETLLDLGAIVRVPIRAANYRSLSERRSEIEWMEGDLRDPEYCTRLVTGMNYVFHCASQRRNAEFHKTHCADMLTGNIEMTLAMVYALKEFPHAHVTFLSSANVPPKIDVIQLAQHAEVDGYVLGKAMCEAVWLTAAKQYHFPLLIIRPAGVYGERDTFTIDGNVIPSLMVKAENDAELSVWGSGKQERVFVYGVDLIRALLTLLDHDVTGIHYVQPTENVTIRRLSEMIRDLVRPDLPIVFDTTKPDGTRSIPIVERHKSLDNFAWTPMMEGLKKTYEGWKRKAK